MHELKLSGVTAPTIAYLVYLNIHPYSEKVDVDFIGGPSTSIENMQAQDFAFHARKAPRLNRRDPQ